MFSTSFRYGVISAVFAGAAALAGFGTAVAHTGSYPSKVEITRGGATGAEGTVTSDQAACRQGRTVHLLRSGQEVGTAQTDANGAWSVSASLLAGVYQAKVDTKTVKTRSSSSGKAETSKKKKKKKKTHIHTCAGAESPSTPL